jgi:penicillin-binding protein 1C
MPSGGEHGAKACATLARVLERAVRLGRRKHLDSGRDTTRRHLDGIGGRSVTQAGVIVIDNASGDILAMIGSNDYTDAAGDGAVNVTTLPRRAGSTLKPFVYGLALERGGSPATLAYDVVLPGEANETYTADVRQHGFARYREALAGSYNLAAVHTLEKVGVRALVDRLRRAGVSTLRAPTETYELSLAIGDAEIALIEYAGAFAAFGNAGRAVRPRGVRRVLSPPGFAVEASERASRPSDGAALAAASIAPSSTRVFSPEVAYQIFDILSDPDARRPMFGRTAPLEVGFPVALKTGTTRGYTDNLAFGTTREFTVGAWAGNFDGTPTDGVMAMQGAAPLVRAAFISLAALYGTPSAPDRPVELTVRDVCPISGQRPGPACPGRKQESFTPLAASLFDAAAPCAFHVQRAAGGSGGPAASLAFPEELAPWARAHGLEQSLVTDASQDARQTGPLSIAYPAPGSVFQIDPHRAARAQVPPVQALPPGDVELTIDGVPARHFEPTPGRHRVRARRQGEVAETEIAFE